METLDVVRIVLGTAIIVVAAFFATRRILFLQGMIRSGQPAVGRTSHVGKRAELEGTQVLAQKKLLQWAIPGVAHVFAFWGFLVLGITVVEALGEVYIENFWFPIIGTWPIVLLPGGSLRHPRVRRDRDVTRSSACSTTRPRKAAHRGSSARIPAPHGSCCS